MAEDRGIAAVRSVRISAPAKINLGLAILGKRADGYHELDTIMAMIDLADTITVHPAETPGISIAGMNDVPLESNLITKAIRGWCERTGQPVAFHVDVEKRIPSPAGLGGGSSDAAAVIRALGALQSGALSGDDRHLLAASLGADCPFFLDVACARATGIGTVLRPLPVPTGWVVIVVPPVDLHAKTSALYGALRPDDYGTPEQMDAVEAALSQLGSIQLPNSFTRAALQSFPTLTRTVDTLTSATGDWSLSGAGPAIFAVTTAKAEAAQWQQTLRKVLPHGYAVRTARFLAEPPQPELMP